MDSNVNESRRVKGRAGIINMIQFYTNNINLPPDLELVGDVKTLLYENVPEQAWYNIEWGDTNSIQRFIKQYVLPLSKNPRVVDLINTNNKMPKYAASLQNVEYRELPIEMGYEMLFGISGTYDITMRVATYPCVIKNSRVNKDTAFLITDNRRSMTEGQVNHIKFVNEDVVYEFFYVMGERGNKATNFMRIAVYDRKDNIIYLDRLDKYTKVPIF